MLLTFRTSYISEVFVIVPFRNHDEIVFIMNLFSQFFLIYSINLSCCAGSSSIPSNPQEGSTRFELLLFRIFGVEKHGGPHGFQATIMLFGKDISWNLAFGKLFIR